MLDIKIVPKGWGHEKWIVNKQEYCGKLLYFIKGRQCSVHFHKLKDETFYVARGKLKVDFVPADAWTYKTDSAPESYAAFWNNAAASKRSTILGPGDAMHIHRMMIHQMTGMVDTEMFEFSTEHFNSDSYRILKGH